MKKLIAIVTVFFCAFLSFSQTNFHHTYGGGGRDIAYSSCETADNGIMILGLTTSFGQGKDLYLMKLDANGNILWSRTYGGKKVDSGIKIKQSKDGNFAIIGNTTSFDAKRRDLFFLKIDAEGNEIWSYCYGGELNEFGLDFAETEDGGFVLVGETNSFEVKDHDILVSKVDKDGILEWTKTIGGDSLEFASSVVCVKDGYILGGETNSIGSGGYDAMLVKLDFSGEVLWSKVYGGAGDDHINDLVEDKWGNLAFIGSTTSFSFGGRDLLFAIVNEQDGHPIVVNTLGGASDDEPQVIRKVGEDGYIIVGFSKSFNDMLTMNDAYIIRMNKKFKMRWSKTFGGFMNDLGFGLITHSKGNFVVVGQSESFSDRADQDIFAVSILDSRKIETCELTNVQTVRIPRHKEIVANNMFFEEVDVKAHTIDSNIEQQNVDTQFLIICEKDLLLIDSNKPEEETEE
jgi:hypothetical protein